MDLFRSTPIAQPLAARLRAANLDEYVGQEHVLARGKPLREALEQGALPVSYTHLTLPTNREV